MNVDKKWAFLDHLSTSSWNVVCEQPLRQIFNPILLPCKNIFGFCQSESTFAWPNESTMNFCYFWEKDQCTKLNVIKYCQIKGRWKSVDIFLNCDYTFLELLCNQLNSIESGVSRNQHFKMKNKTQKNWVPDRSQMLLRLLTLKKTP